MTIIQPAQYRTETEAIPPADGDVPAIIRAFLTGLALGESIEAGHFGDVLSCCVELRPPVRDVVLGSVMTAVMVAGPDVDAIEAILRAALSLDQPEAELIAADGLRGPVVVLAGSGKKGKRTLNVSTPAALVAAAAGANIVKVGSAATSSALGSRDLIQALGMRELDDVSEVRGSLLRSGFAFVAIEPRIPRIDALYGGRFYAPNPFSFGLAPLASPVRGDLLVYGLSHPRPDIAAEVLRRFGFANIDVLATRTPCGAYLDEVGPDGDLRLVRVREGATATTEIRSVASFIGGHLPDPALPAPSSASDAASQVIELLGGRGSERHRRVVALNAAYLLMRTGVSSSMRAGMAVADDILRTGLELGRFTEDSPDAAGGRAAVR